MSLFLQLFGIQYNTTWFENGIQPFSTAKQQEITKFVSDERSIILPVH